MINYLPKAQTEEVSLMRDMERTVVVPSTTKKQIRAADHDSRRMKEESKQQKATTLTILNKVSKQLQSLLASDGVTLSQVNVSWEQLPLYYYCPDRNILTIRSNNIVDSSVKRVNNYAYLCSLEGSDGKFDRFLVVTHSSYTSTSSTTNATEKKPNIRVVISNAEIDDVLRQLECQILTEAKKESHRRQR